MIPVNEIFETIQGEARWTGTPAVFVRLQGCAVGCPWCDTRHTWVLDQGKRVSPAEMLGKTASSASWADMTDEAIVVEVMQHRARHVVITGGEPCLYDLKVLCRLLQSAGCMVQVETSGTQPVRVSRGTWVTVSPKIGMPGKFEILREAIMRADEIKMPVGAQKDVKRVKDLLEQHPDWAGDVWLQPLSRSEKATQLCIEAATKNGFRLSIQTHAFIGVR